MKTKKKAFVAAIAALIMTAAACMAFTACGNDGGAGSGGSGSDPADVSYNVTTSTAELATFSTYTDMIASIRPMGVEVYGDGYGTDDRGNTVLMTSAGAGVIIGSDGDGGYYIVTNQHVVEDCYSMYVKVLTIADDGAESTEAYTAEFIGGSHERDIAVIRIESDEKLTTATWMDNVDELKPGCEVVAIGNPTGTLGGTVTRGIVSQTSRKISVENIGSMDLIQMDAAINSGNSGGGLFYTYENGEGEWSAALCGIVNSGATGYDGLGFAIPADDAKYAADNLIDPYNDGSDPETVYGYVPGDASLTLTAMSGLVYTDDLSGRESVVCAQYATSTDLAELDTYEEYLSGETQTFDAIREISITDAETDKTVVTPITSTDDVYGAFEEVSVGDKLEITVEAVESRRVGFFESILALSETEETITVDSLSQYRYAPPAAPSIG